MHWRNHRHEISCILVMQLVSSVVALAVDAWGSFVERKIRRRKKLSSRLYQLCGLLMQLYRICQSICLRL